jgi:hypothetical protein
MLTLIKMDSLEILKKVWSGDFFQKSYVNFRLFSFI